MAKNVFGVVCALAAWIVLVTAAGLVLRESWPAYAAAAAAMTFTLPMMIARLSIGAAGTVGAGYVCGRIAPARAADLVTGVLLLVVFVPQHVSLWARFPVWYHLTFLLSLVPLTYAGGSLARAAGRSATRVASPTAGDLSRA